jgi:hypothetical protein
VLLALSLGAAGIYTALVAVGFWETVVNILVVAGAIYAFAIQRFESSRRRSSVFDSERTWRVGSVRNK